MNRLLEESPFIKELFYGIGINDTEVIRINEVTMIYCNKYLTEAKNNRLAQITLHRNGKFNLIIYNPRGLTARSVII